MTAAPPGGSGRSVRSSGMNPAVVRTIALSGLLCTAQVEAFEFSYSGLDASFDTTVSHGATVRNDQRDPSLVARANGGTANSANFDDGNLNYKRSLVSRTSKLTSELEVHYRNFGAFVRANGFLDTENEHGARQRTALGEDAKNLVGEDLDVLDFYLAGHFEFGDVPADLRVGKHVLSWGESTFIQNSINVVNPFDVSKLRVPGAELREALVPVPMISLAVAPTVSLSVEGFYQLDWDKTEIDPPGTYFSTNDFAGAGGRKAQLGFGGVPDTGFGFGAATAAINADLALAGVAAQPAFDPDFLGVPRGADRNPDESGQWGVALRYLAEELDDTELGVYFINYHSRLPVISARTGTPAGVANANAALLAVCPAVGGPLPACTGVVTGVVAGTATATSAASSIATDRYAKTARYFVEYPENIALLGLSFNTQLGASGWALQGEYSLRRDAPLQIDDTELLLAALTPLAFSPAFAVNQLGTFGTNRTVTGFIERDVSQAQATATRVFGPTLGADSWLLAVEGAVMHVHRMPSRGTLRLEGPGTATSGNPFHATAAGAHAGLAAEPWERFPSATSFGYRVATRLDYNNVLGAVNVSPRLQLQHDVRGTSPGPGGPLVEDRIVLTVGIGASYLNRWRADVSYTAFSGASRYHLLNDRDFASATIQYSF